MSLSAPATNAGPSFQFTLRQLLGAMAATCVFAAASHSLGIGLAIFLTVFFGAIVVSVLLAVRRHYFEALITIATGLIITSLLLPVVGGARDSPRWASCQNNMHNIALALQQYETINGTFPPAYIADADGKPMHSWRVLLLPFVEHKALYNRYRFDEPWDGPNNSQLHGVRVRYYECPSDAYATRNTSYLAVTGPQTIWPGATSTKTSDIKDGPANTILLVEVHNSGIHWMEPRDLDFATMPMTVNSGVVPSISSAHNHHGPFANIAFADGRAERIANSTSSKSLRAAFTISGKEKDKLPTVRLPR